MKKASNDAFKVAGFLDICMVERKLMSPCHRNAHLSSLDNETANNCYFSFQPFNTQTRRKGPFCFVLTLSPRFYAFLNKRMLDCSLN